MKSMLLAFVAVILLSACGVKGDLYQTPEHQESATETSVEASSERTNNNSLEAESSDAQLEDKMPANQPTTNPEAEQE